MKYRLEWGESYAYTYEEGFETLEEVKQWIKNFGYPMRQGWECKRDGHWYEVYQLIDITL